MFCFEHVYGYIFWSYFFICLFICFSDDFICLFFFLTVVQLSTPFSFSSPSFFSFFFFYFLFIFGSGELQASSNSAHERRLYIYDLVILTFTSLCSTEAGAKGCPQRRDSFLQSASTTYCFLETWRAHRIPHSVSCLAPLYSQTALEQHLPPASSQCSKSGHGCDRYLEKLVFSSLSLKFVATNIYIFKPLYLTSTVFDSLFSYIIDFPGVFFLIIMECTLLFVILLVAFG